MVRLLADREKAGVDVKIIGKVDAKGVLHCEKYQGKRLHVRAIIRDGKLAFVGSQSLRRLELEKRREVGIIVNDERVVREMQTGLRTRLGGNGVGQERSEESREGRQKRGSRRVSSRSASRGRRPAMSRATATCCGDRQKSIVDTRCTQPTVQKGAHDFGVENSRRMSSVVYVSSGTPG